MKRRRLREPELLGNLLQRQLRPAQMIDGDIPPQLILEFLKTGAFLAQMPAQGLRADMQMRGDGFQIRPTRSVATEQAAQAAGYRLLLCDTQGREELERQFAELVYAYQADGVIQLRAYDPFENAPPDADVPPIVNACEVIKAGRYPTISLDNVAAAKAMTDHLIALGHRRIGLIKGSKNSPLTLDRLAGYEAALREAGIAIDEALICHGNFSLEAGFAGAQKMLALAERPSALFCENDEMAIGALKRIRQAGLRVPEDISVVGFDDIPMAAFCDPPLTTISQPAEAFGAKAVEMLIALIEKRPLAERHVVLPFELTPRSSTARIDNSGKR